MNKKILFFCGTPPHPIHEKFAKSIRADFYYFPDGANIFEKIKSLIKIPKDYDVYFSEGLFGYLNLIKKIRLISKKSKCVNLFSDPRLFQLTEGKKFNFRKKISEKYPFLMRKFQINSIKNLDFAICIGNYQTKLLKKIYSKAKILTVPPMIERKIFFEKETSLLNKNNIFFLGGGPDYNYKGLDFLIKIFNQINKKFPESKLYVIGSGWDVFKNKVKNKNILFVGKRNVKEIIDIMKNCSLCCHFGRGEATGISILEAMIKGLPSLVSDKTGAKQYVNKADSRFVKKFNEKKKIVELIENYFRLSQKEKQALGKKFRKEVICLTERNAIKDFKRKFREVV